MSTSSLPFDICILNSNYTQEDTYVLITTEDDYFIEYVLLINEIVYCGKPMHCIF